MAGKQSVYDIVTSRILDALERGTVPWRKPWADNAPLNLVSAKPYRGVNVLLLELSRMSAGYDSPIWATFKQWKAAGGTVRKGERGTLITFWKTLKYEDSRPGQEDETRTVPLLRYYYVFNLAQVDNVRNIPTRTIRAAGLERPRGFDAEKVADETILGMPLRPIMVDGNAASYNHVTDVVTLPDRSTFFSAPEYYATAFHELAHSTAHESRIGRSTIGHAFGTADYAREELIAELSSAMLLAACGIDAPEAIENAAAYVDNWRKVLSADPKLIVSAAAAAQRVADYIRNEPADTERVAA